MNKEHLRKYALTRGIDYSENIECHNDDDDLRNTKVLSLNQLSVHAIASSYAANDIRLRGKRGALVFHETGSGKTCCVSCIIDAFWDTPLRIFVVSSPSAMKSNPPANYHRCCVMLPRFAGDSEDSIAKQFSKRHVEFVTFAVLAHRTGVYRASRKARDFGTDPCLFIIDEAHTIFRPLPNQRNEMHAVMDVLLTRNQKDRIFLLTATPGESRSDIVRMLDVLRDPTILPPLFVPKDADEAKKFVSQIDHSISRFDTRFESSYPTVEIQDVRLPMSVRQYQRYREAVASTKVADRRYTELKRQQKLSRLYASARRFSNALYRIDPSDPLGVVSCKLPEILRRISAFEKQKHFVYSAFGDRRGDLGGQGIQAVAKVLVDSGYLHIEFPDVRRVVRLMEDGGDPPLLRVPRFVLVNAGTSDSELADVLSLFNCYGNRYGEYLQVFLASGNFYESVDLKAVRHVHLFDPMLSVFAQQQAIGRAARRCSHSQLDTDSRTVTVHRYFAVAPSEKDIRDMIYVEKDPKIVRHLEELAGYVRRKTIDEFVDELTLKRYSPVKTMLSLLEFAAADCAVWNERCHHGVVNRERKK